MTVASSVPTTSRAVDEAERAAVPVVAAPVEVARLAGDNDPLAAFGPIVAAVAESDRRSSELTADQMCIRDSLSLAYTPGVGRVASAIARRPADAWALTAKGTSVAIATDGSAVLGLGALGPLAALPVMEGKALIFKHFAGVNAYPICLDTHSTCLLYTSRCV